MRQGGKQEPPDGRRRKGSFDDHSGEVEEVLHQDDERIEGEAESGRPEHLLEDVAREDLHRSYGLYVLAAHRDSASLERFPQSLVRQIMLIHVCDSARWQSR